MKANLFLLVLCLALLIVPAISVIAQEEEAAAGSESAGETATEAAQGLNTGAAKGWFEKLIGSLSQIGSIFGKATGIRIGGTTGTAILTLLIAKFAANRIPSWAKFLLYAGGGTMIAGGSANIMQLAMGFLK